MCVRVCVCVHRSVKSLRKLHFAFRTNDDDVEWKTCRPASREKRAFAFQKPWEGQEGGGEEEGKTSADALRTPNSAGGDQYAQ